MSKTQRATMRRRGFLKASGVAAAAATWPALIRQAFAAPAPDAVCDDRKAKLDASTSSKQALFQAYQRGNKGGRPLLVIVIPADRSTRYQRGRLWGGLLNWGDDDALASFGLCEVVCAEVKDVAALVPAIGDVKPEPLGFLIETDRTPASWRVIDGKIPAMPSERDSIGGGQDAWAAQRKREDKAVERQHAALAALVRTAVGDAPARAACLRSAGELRSLAARARSALKDHRVPGSKWAESGGCGTTVELLPDEERETWGIACGMGHVPEKSQRMLYFFAKNDPL